MHILVKRDTILYFQQFSFSIFVNYYFDRRKNPFHIIETFSYCFVIIIDFSYQFGYTYYESPTCVAGPCKLAMLCTGV